MRGGGYPPPASPSWRLAVAQDRPNLDEGPDGREPTQSRRGTGRPFPRTITPGPPSSREPLSASVAHHLTAPTLASPIPGDYERRLEGVNTPSASEQPQANHHPVASGGGLEASLLSLIHQHHHHHRSVLLRDRTEKAKIDAIRSTAGIGDFEKWMKMMYFDCKNINAAIRNIHQA
ncbi:hypothetical protein NL676_032910 [Syzygium grande]|nr:hypothetical protein NL676_032910 [Syzygium grande]